MKLLPELFAKLSKQNDKMDAPLSRFLCQKAELFSTIKKVLAASQFVLRV